VSKEIVHLKVSQYAAAFEYPSEQVSLIRLKVAHDGWQESGQNVLEAVQSVLAK
jgi:hypothetical protein